MKHLILKQKLNLLCLQFEKEEEYPTQILSFDNDKEWHQYLQKNEEQAEPLLVTYLNANTAKQQECSPATTTPPIYDSVFVRQDEYYRKICLADVMWLEASRSYSYIHRVGSSRLILSHPLAEIKKFFPEETFMQIHRSYVVNMKFVDAFVGNMLYIGKQSFPISKTYRNQVLSKFNFLDTK